MPLSQKSDLIIYLLLISLLNVLKNELCLFFIYFIWPLSPFGSGAAKGGPGSSGPLRNDINI